MTQQEEFKLELKGFQQSITIINYQKRYGLMLNFKVENAIWQNLLNLKHVGIHDDYFEIGGDSIISMKAAHQISENLSVV